MLIFAYFMLAPFLPCMAQDTPTPIPWYFDDGGISTSKNIIKIDPLGVAQGEYGLTWERFYYKILTVEISAGILSKQYKYKFLLDGLISDWYNNFNPEKPG